VASWDCEPVVLAERGGEPEENAGPWPEQPAEDAAEQTE
jgi:hypothetical protein